MDVTGARYLEFKAHSLLDSLIVSQQKLSNGEWDLGDDDAEDLYALGYDFFTCGRYQAAKDIFVGLTGAYVCTGFYWRALGAVNQQMRNYAEAIAAYDRAIANDETDLVSHVYRGESQILSGDIESATEGLGEALNIGVQDPGSKRWHERARLLLSLHG